MGGQISRLKFLRRGHETAGKHGRYSVILFHDERTPIRGKLEITLDDIIFHQRGKSSLVWPIRSIRRYGCENNAFSFESGRRCSSGPGHYSFRSKQSELIFSRVQDSVVQIAALDMSSRLTSGLNRYEIARVSPKPVLSQVNQYLNCDSSGRFNGDLDWCGADGDTLPQAKRISSSPSVQYTDLLLTPPRASLSGSEGGLSVGTGSATKLDFIRGFDPDSKVTYAQIDATKSKAVANLSARSHS